MIVVGWQGFSFPLPEEFAPVAVRGTRHDGYLRLEDGRQFVQLRWMRGPATQLRTTVEKYLGQMGSRKKDPVQFTIHDGDPLTYSYRGAHAAAGLAFWRDERCFLLESGGRSHSAIVKHLQQIASAFELEGEWSDWSVFGLSLRLPSPFELKRHKFFAGRTELEFAHRSSRLMAARWGFAEQLLDRHGLRGWAAATLNWPVEAFTEGEGGLQGRFRLQDALVVHQAEKNQLVVLTQRGIRPQWKLSWDWITSDVSSVAEPALLRPS